MSCQLQKLNSRDAHKSASMTMMVHACKPFIGNMQFCTMKALYSERLTRHLANLEKRDQTRFPSFPTLMSDIRVGKTRKARSASRTVDGTAGAEGGGGLKALPLLLLSNGAGFARSPSASASAPHLSVLQDNLIYIYITVIFISPLYKYITVIFI